MSDIVRWVKGGLNIGLRIGMVTALLVSGTGLVGQFHPPVAAAYDTAAIADTALHYYSGSNADGQRAPASRACQEAHKPGDSGGQCRAFVNCIVWLASGGSQNIGGDYFQAFERAGGREIGVAKDMAKGDIVQYAEPHLHTLIIVANNGGGHFTVVDANNWGDETVGRYDRTIVLGSGVRAFRMGGDVPSNHLPYGHVDSVVRVPAGVQVAGWAADADSDQPLRVHIYSGTGQAASPNPGVAVTANHDRPDVARARGIGAAHGFDTVVPLSKATSQRICVYAINTPQGINPDIGCQTAAISHQPYGPLDRLQRVGATVQLAGWVIDPDTAASVRVRISSDHAATSSYLVAGGSRPDVAAVYPAYGDAHGFSGGMPISAVPQSVCVSALDETEAAFLLGCKHI